MKRADLIVAIILAVFSIYLMVLSSELPIGWIPESGPGGGAFPFWLALGMFVCCIAIILRNLFGWSKEGRSTWIFIDRESLRLFLIVLASLTVMIGLIHVIGVYFSVPLFLIFYMRHLGRHSWALVLSVSMAVPVVTFVLFERMLLILLPKGFTETWFYIFY